MQFHGSIEAAVIKLKQGGVVAFPTETYYGLAADPDNKTAVAKIFSIKRRQEEKPLLLLIEDISHLRSIVRDIPDIYLPLMDKYWPGPLTLIFGASRSVNSRITGNSGTVGVRISPHPVAAQLVKQMGKPITATSANISGRAPAKSAREVWEMLGDSVDYIIDGGQTEAGLCSTLLGQKNGQLILLRPGQIDLSEELSD